VPIQLLTPDTRFLVPMQLTRLGPYEIEKPLGKGGMGSVYSATDTHTGQRVAIKALTPHLAMASGFRERFESEIESLKTLRHDGIVRLYGYGEQDGVLFYSMELVDGISLEDELKAGRRFNWREVSNIAIQLSLALKHAHDHGVVHRDIKPANILLFDENRVKLADFGIARLFGATQLTTAGGVLGTADYMSPEQADGRPVTARCDQYSLGGVMYALLAGRPPFHAKSLPQMLQLQRFANPEPVRRYAPDTPEQLEQVIMQLLAKEPADRFPNMQVLSRHLQAMVMALSRPTADDFALASDQPNLDQPSAGIDQSLAIRATQTEIESPPRNGSKEQRRLVGQPTAAHSQDAATLAADESDSGQRAAPSAVSSEAAIENVVKHPADRPAHFVTMEEEEARRREQHQRSWVLVAIQLVLLASILAAMAAIALYLARPRTADDLYATITAKISASDEASLIGAENEIIEFLNRYSDDPRSVELQRYKGRIESSKLERKLQRQARGNGITDPSLLPAEQLYLKAADLVDRSPDTAIAMLQSLIDLYGATSAGESTTGLHKKIDRKTREEADRTANVVQLAQRKLATLRADLAEQRRQLLTTLGERLDAAGQLTKTNRQQAAAVYRAIINLHQDDSWATGIVEQARNRLAELEK
jgi:eukaryotic-like serine/threonine-protein kinase